MKILWCVVCVVLLISRGENVDSTVKTWKYNVDADDQRNWLEANPTDNCRGLIFPEKFTEGCMMSVYRMVTTEIVLPADGEVVFKDGSTIVFSEKSTNCVRLKQPSYKNWADPDSWISSANKATPDIEKIPCRHDDVVFPKDSTVAVVYPGTLIQVNSIRVRGKNLTNEEWKRAYAPHEGCNEYVSDYFGSPEISIAPDVCKLKGGCVCQEEEELLWAMCLHLEHGYASYECSRPIKPIGNCRNFCGGVIHLEPAEHFDLEAFKKTLPDSEDVDFHASKVKKDDKSVVQVTITDRNRFTGESVFVAKSLHEKIERDPKSWNVKSSTLQVSGYGFSTKATIRSSVSIVFGTLFAVVVVFCGLYAFFVGPLRNYSVATNFSLSKFSGARPRRPYVFARFENRDDGGLSIGGSILSLEKSFENPMYGRNVPSTSTTTLVETIPEDSPDEKPTTHETGFKNPMYDETEATDDEVHDP